MKKIFAILLMGTSVLLAQDPATDQPAPKQEQPAAVPAPEQPAVNQAQRDAAMREALQRAVNTNVPVTTGVGNTNRRAPFGAGSRPTVPGRGPGAQPTASPTTTGTAAPGNAPATTPATNPTATPPTTQPGEVAISPSGAAAAAAPPEQMLGKGEINWTAAKLDQVLGIYAELVDKTILRPSNLQSPDIVLKTQTPLTRREAIQAIEAVLAMNGIALVHVDPKFVKAVPQAQSNTEGAPFVEMDPTNFPSIGTYMTALVQTKYVKPSEIMPALTPYSKIPNAILPIDANQMLVIRDYTENVKRVLEMIKKLDVAVPEEFISEVIPIKYALAGDIASAINSLGGGGGSTSVGSSGRTGATGAGGARTGFGGATGGRGGYGGTTGMGGLGGLGGAQPFGNQGITQPGGALGTPSSGASFSDRLNRIISRAASSSGDLQLLGTTKIIADERMNALLVFASRTDMTTITNIIAKLDVVLAQVLIETIILDVSLDNTFDFGVSAAQKPKDFNKTLTGAGGMNFNKFFDFTGGSNTNAFGDLLGSGLKYFGKVNEDIVFSLEAAATDGRVNVIQKPRIQTSHATPASIFIGSTVPYVTGSYYGGYGGGPGSTYQQLRVGIGLNVTPFINPEGLVVMKIDESIDELSGSTQIENVGAVPNTTSRTLSAEVAVRDGESIILGGFIRNSEQKSHGGIPYLKDIPILGYLFKSSTDTKERKELLVLMRPTVLRTPELAAQHVEVEKARLPGVMAAERDFNENDVRAAKAQDIRDFKNVTPFTPEEIKLYGNPDTKP